MADKKAKLHTQYAALPVRLNPAGAVEILLVTSRGAQRWIIPKGWPIRKLTPAATAAREAYEEAGLEGEIDGPIGSYRYSKRIASGALACIEVSIYLLRVVRQLPVWPEQSERRTGWFDPQTAADQVAEPELATILRGLRPALLVPGHLVPSLLAPVPEFSA